MSRYTETLIETWHAALLAKQQEKGLYVTVHEAAIILGNPTSTSAAKYKLDHMIQLGKIKKIRNHYHVLDLPQPAERSQEAPSVFHD